MANFEHLKELAVEHDSTTFYLFSRIMGLPRLEVRPAHRINPLFLNEMIRGSKEAARRLSSEEMPDQKELDKVRLRDADIFARCIVVGWENVIDSEGNEVEFTEDHCREFLMAIPVDMFDDLRVFCMLIDNFRTGSLAISREEEEALTGN